MALWQTFAVVRLRPILFYFYFFIFGIYFSFFFYLRIWIAAHQASLSFTLSLGLLKFMSIESVILSNHLILCHSLLLPSIFPTIRVFSNE